MSRKKHRNGVSPPKPADPAVDAPLRLPGDQPVQSGMHALASVIVLAASVALAFWAGKEMYAIVVEGKICRPRYGCESWSSNPVSLGAQCMGSMLLTTIFLGVAYGRLQALLGRASDDRA